MSKAQMVQSRKLNWHFRFDMFYRLYRSPGIAISISTVPSKVHRKHQDISIDILILSNKTRVFQKQLIFWRKLTLLDVWMLQKNKKDTRTSCNKSFLVPKACKCFAYLPTASFPAWTVIILSFWEHQFPTIKARVFFRLMTCPSSTKIVETKKRNICGPIMCMHGWKWADPAVSRRRALEKRSREEAWSGSVFQRLNTRTGVLG